MLFVLHGYDRKPDGAEVRRRTRAAHLEFISTRTHIFRYGGALLDEAGKMIGSLMMIELPDRAALDRYLAEDPYTRAGLYDPLHINETRQVLPEVTPGFLAAELQRERAKG